MVTQCRIFACDSRCLLAITLSNDSHLLIGSSLQAPFSVMHLPFLVRFGYSVLPFTSSVPDIFILFLCTSF